MGLEVMLFARRMLVMGVWIPPKRAEMMGAHTHTPNGICQLEKPQRNPCRGHQRARGLSMGSDGKSEIS